MSANSTLIAGIGTLLLALGVGVLIGREGNGTSKAPPAQVVTVATGGSSGTASTTPATEQPSASATKASKSGAASSPTAVKGAAKTTAPPAKVVTVGTPGKGRGYQNGHFTGNFFGSEEK